ncbi:MAG TPA: hypothetical protein VFV50_11365, partial [Bdellovibrionales bacterium]|nr:hypothetical protein [Bdellovibrionales bacterium]
MSRVLERHKLQKSKGSKAKPGRALNGAAAKSARKGGASKQAGKNGVRTESQNGKTRLPSLKLEPALLKKIHDLMVKSR